MSYICTKHLIEIETRTEFILYHCPSTFTLLVPKVISLNCCYDAINCGYSKFRVVIHAGWYIILWDWQYYLYSRIFINDNITCLLARTTNLGYKMTEKQHRMGIFFYPTKGLSFLPTFCSFVLVLWLSAIMTLILKGIY